MKIEIGDLVQTNNKSARLTGSLKVIDITGENVLCAFYLLDKDLQGDERPTSMDVTHGIFQLSELTLVRKGTDQNINNYE